MGRHINMLLQSVPPLFFSLKTVQWNKAFMEPHWGDDSAADCLRVKIKRQYTQNLKLCSGMKRWSSSPDEKVTRSWNISASFPQGLNPDAVICSFIYTEHMWQTCIKCFSVCWEDPCLPGSKVLFDAISHFNSSGWTMLSVSPRCRYLSLPI